MKILYLRRKRKEMREPPFLVAPSSTCATPLYLELSFCSQELYLLESVSRGPVGHLFERPPGKKYTGCTLTDSSVLVD